MENPVSQPEDSVGPPEDPPPPPASAAADASAPPHPAQDQSTSESLGGESSGRRRPQPPLSPLTGCYLLIVIGEPHSERHKEIILQRIAKAFLSWNVNECHVSLEKELQAITGQSPEGEEIRYGERLIQFATENLVTEILIHPQLNTLHQCMKNLLSSFTKHRHIIHAGYTFAGNGSWILQDGTLSISDLVEALHEPEVLRVLKAYENSVSIDIHCASEGDWTTDRFQREPVTKLCSIRVNPGDVMTAGHPAISTFIDYLAPFLEPANIQQLLQPTDVVGNIRFTHPTLYVFPGGQGDAALFGINGFNMLIDGGFARKACFWDFARHLDRLDAVLLTRLNNSTVNGISAVLQRKKMNHVYPQIGHFFCNLQDRKIALSPDGDKDKDSLIVNLAEEGHEIVANLRHLALKPHPCYRDGNQIDPVNLYHKVGHGKLDMYVISPARDSQAVKEFLAKWTSNDSHLFSNTGKKTGGGKAFEFPLQNLVSICALLVWQPANPSDTITRILFPGSTPQHKIFEGLEKLRHLEFLKHPVCSARTISPSASSVTVTRSASKTRQSKPVVVDNKQMESKTVTKTYTKHVTKAKVEKEKEKVPTKESKPKLDTNKLADEKKDGVVEATTTTTTTTTATATTTTAAEDTVKKLENRILTKDEQIENIKNEIQKIEMADSEDLKKRIVHRSKYDMRNVKSKVDSRAPSKSVDRKKLADRKAEGETSPPGTPKKGLTNGSAGKLEKAVTATRVTAQRATRAASPSSTTPAKSAKEANNRKVVEARVQTRSTSKSLTRKKEETPPPQQQQPQQQQQQQPSAQPAAKTERKPISRRPKPASSSSPVKSATGKPVKQETESQVKKLTRKVDVNADVVKVVGRKLVDLQLKGAETEKTDSHVRKSTRAQPKAPVAEKVLAENKETDLMAVNTQIQMTTGQDRRTKGTKGDDNEDEEEEEYLIITKEEYVDEEGGQEEPQNRQETEGEGEIKKLRREEVESEKRQKGTDEDDKGDDTAGERQVEAAKEDDAREKPVEADEDEKEMPEDVGGKGEERKPEDDGLDQGKDTDAAKAEDGVHVKEAASKEPKEGESLPEEKISNTVETSATTAPTLPEDEKVEEPQPQDQGKTQPDDVHEVVEEKYIQEETKEEKHHKEIVEARPETPVFQTAVQPEVPAAVVSMGHRKPRDVVKTPDEVADLPVHEEVDPRTYYSVPDDKHADDEYPIDSMTPREVEERLNYRDEPTGLVQSSITSKYLNIIDSLEKSAPTMPKIPTSQLLDDVKHSDTTKTNLKPDSEPDEAVVTKSPDKVAEDKPEVQEETFAKAQVLPTEAPGQVQATVPGLDNLGKFLPSSFDKDFLDKATPAEELGAVSPQPHEKVGSGQSSPDQLERKLSAKSGIYDLDKGRSSSTSPDVEDVHASGKTTPQPGASRKSSVADGDKVPSGRSSRHDSGKSTPVEPERKLSTKDVVDSKETPRESEEGVAPKVISRRGTPTDLEKGPSTLDKSSSPQDFSKPGTPLPADEDKKPSRQTTPTDTEKPASGRSSRHDSGKSTPIEPERKLSDREPSRKGSPTDLDKLSSRKSSIADVEGQPSRKSSQQDSTQTTAIEPDRKLSLKDELKEAEAKDALRKDSVDEKEPSGRGSPEDTGKEPSRRGSAVDLDRQPSRKGSAVDLEKQPSRRDSPDDLDKQPSRKSSAVDLDKEPSRKGSPDDLEKEPSRKGSAVDLAKEPSRRGSPEDLEKEPSRKGSPDDLEKEPSRRSSTVDLANQPSRKGSALDYDKEPSRKGSPEDHEKQPSRKGSAVDLDKQPSRKGSHDDVEKEPSRKGSVVNLDKQPSRRDSPDDLGKQPSRKGSTVELEKQPSGRSSRHESGKTTPEDLEGSRRRLSATQLDDVDTKATDKKPSDRSSPTDADKSGKITPQELEQPAPAKPEETSSRKSSVSNLEKTSSRRPSQQDTEETLTDKEPASRQTLTDTDKQPSRQSSGKTTPVEPEGKTSKGPSPAVSRKGSLADVDRPSSRRPSHQEPSKVSPVEPETKSGSQVPSRKGSVADAQRPPSRRPSESGSGKATPVEPERKSSKGASPVASRKGSVADAEREPSRRQSPQDSGKVTPIEPERKSPKESSPVLSRKGSVADGERPSSRRQSHHEPGKVTPDEPERKSPKDGSQVPSRKGSVTDEERPLSRKSSQPGSGKVTPVEPEGKTSKPGSPAVSRKGSVADAQREPSRRASPHDSGKTTPGEPERKSPKAGSQVPSRKGSVTDEERPLSRKPSQPGSGKVTPVEPEGKTSKPGSPVTSRKSSVADVERPLSRKSSQPDSGKVTPDEPERKLSAKEGSQLPSRKGSVADAERPPSRRPSQSASGKVTPVEPERKLSAKPDTEEPLSGKLSPIDLKKELTSKEPERLDSDTDIDKELPKPGSERSSPAGIGITVEEPCQSLKVPSDTSQPKETLTEAKDGKESPADLSRRSSRPDSGKSTPEDLERRLSTKSSFHEMGTGRSGGTTPSERQFSGASSPDRDLSTKSTPAEVVDDDLDKSPGKDSADDLLEKKSLAELDKKPKEADDEHRPTAGMPTGAEGEVPTPKDSSTDVDKEPSRKASPISVDEDTSKIPSPHDRSGKTTPDKPETVGTEDKDDHKAGERISPTLPGEVTDKKADKELLPDDDKPEPLTSATTADRKLFKDDAHVLEGHKSPSDLTDKQTPETKDQEDSLKRATPTDVTKELPRKSSFVGVDEAHSRPESGKTSPIEPGRGQPDDGKTSSGKSSPDMPPDKTTPQEQQKKSPTKSSPVPEPGTAASRKGSITDVPAKETSSRRESGEQVIPADRRPSTKDVSPAVADYVPSGKSPADPTLQAPSRGESPTDSTKEPSRQPSRQDSGKSTPVQPDKTGPKISTDDTDKEPSRKSSPTDLVRESMKTPSEQDLQKTTAAEPEQPLTTQQVTDKQPSDERSAGTDPQDTARRTSLTDGKKSPAVAVEKMSPDQRRCSDQAPSQELPDRASPEEQDKEQTRQTTPTDTEKPASGRSSRHDSGKSTPVEPERKLSDREPSRKGSPTDLDKLTSRKSSIADAKGEQPSTKPQQDSTQTTAIEPDRKLSLKDELKEAEAKDALRKDSVGEKEPSRRGSPEDTGKEPSRRGSADDLDRQPSRKGSVADEEKQPSRRDSPDDLEKQPSRKGSTVDLEKLPSMKESPADLDRLPSRKGSVVDLDKQPSRRGSNVDLTKQPSRKGSPENLEKEPSRKGSAVDLDRQPSRKSSAVDQDKQPSRKGSVVDLDKELSRKRSPDDLEKEPSRSSSAVDLAKEPSRKGSPEDLEKEPSRKGSTHDLDKEPSRKSSAVDFDKEPLRKGSPEHLEKQPSRKSSTIDLEKQPSRKGSVVNLDKQPSRRDSPDDLEKQPSRKGSAVDLEKQPSRKSSTVDLENQPTGKGSPDNLEKAPSRKGSAADLDKHPSGRSSRHDSGKTTPRDGSLTEDDYHDAVNIEDKALTPQQPEKEPFKQDLPFDKEHGRRPSQEPVKVQTIETVTLETEKIPSGKSTPVTSGRQSPGSPADTKEAEPSRKGSLADTDKPSSRRDSGKTTPVEPERRSPGEPKGAPSGTLLPTDQTKPGSEQKSPAASEKGTPRKGSPEEPSPSQPSGKSSPDFSSNLKSLASEVHKLPDTENLIKSVTVAYEQTTIRTPEKSGDLSPDSLDGRNLSGQQTPQKLEDVSGRDSGKLLSPQSPVEKDTPRKLFKDEPATSGSRSPQERAPDRDALGHTTKDDDEKPGDKIASGQGSPRDDEPGQPGKTTPLDQVSPAKTSPLAQEDSSTERKPSGGTSPQLEKPSGKLSPSGSDKSGVDVSKVVPVDVQRDSSQPSGTTIPVTHDKDVSGRSGTTSPTQHLPQHTSTLTAERKQSGTSTPLERDYSGKTTPAGGSEHMSELDGFSSGKSTPQDLVRSSRDSSDKHFKLHAGLDVSGQSTPRSLPGEPISQFSGKSTPFDDGESVPTGKSSPQLSPKHGSGKVSPVTVKRDPFPDRVPGRKSGEIDFAQISPENLMMRVEERRDSLKMTDATTSRLDFKIGKTPTPPPSPSTDGADGQDQVRQDQVRMHGKVTPSSLSTIAEVPRDDQPDQTRDKRVTTTMETSVSESVSSGPPEKDVSGKSTPFSPDKEISGKVSPPVSGKPTSDSVSLALAERGTSGTCSLERESLAKSSSPSPVDISPLSLDDVRDVPREKRSQVHEEVTIQTVTRVVKTVSETPSKNPLDRLRYEDGDSSSRASTPDRSNLERSDASIPNGVDSEEEIEKGILESERQEKESQILDVSSGEEEELKGLGVDDDDADSELDGKRYKPDSAEASAIPDDVTRGDIGKVEKEDINQLVKTGVISADGEDDDSDQKSGVRRMLVTASSEDGGTETEICIEGGVKIIKEIVIKSEDIEPKGDDAGAVAGEAEEEEFSNLILEARREYNNQRSRRTSYNSSADDAEDRREVEREVERDAEGGGGGDDNDSEELGTLLMQARQELAFVRSKSKEPAEMEMETTEQTVVVTKTTTTSQVTQAEDQTVIRITTKVTEEREEREDGTVKVTTTKETTTKGGKDEGTVVTVATRIESGSGNGMIESSPRHVVRMCHDVDDGRDRGSEAEMRATHGDLETSRRTSTSSVISQEDLVCRKDSGKVEEFRQSSTEMSPLKTTYITSHGDSESLMTSSFYGNLPTEDEMRAEHMRSLRKGRGYESVTEIGPGGERLQRTYFYERDDDPVRFEREKTRFVKTYYTEESRQGDDEGTDDDERRRYIHKYYTGGIPGEESTIERTQFVQRFYTEEGEVQREPDARYRFVRASLPEEPEEDPDYARAVEEHVSARGQHLLREVEQSARNGRSVEVEESAGGAGVASGEVSTGVREETKKKRDVIEGWGKPLGLPLPPKNNRTYVFPGQNISTTSSLSTPTDNSDSVTNWGQPMSLPTPAPPQTQNGTAEATTARGGTPNKETPKKDKVQMKKAGDNNRGSGTNTPNRRSQSPAKFTERRAASAGRTKSSSTSHVYLDLTYVPHHGNSYYSNVEFFKKVRARYYVFSGTEPSKEVYNALLEAKQTWEDKKLEVTIIPTYDTDVLGYWVAENEEILARHKIDLSPSASRCTINLQDHETSCSAYRLEF